VLKKKNYKERVYSGSLKLKVTTKNHLKKKREKKTKIQEG